MGKKQGLHKPKASGNRCFKREKILPEGLEGSLTYTTDALIADFWLPLRWKLCAVWCSRGVLPAGREGASWEGRQAWSLSFSKVAKGRRCLLGAVLVPQSSGEKEHCPSSSFLTSIYSFVYRANPKQNPKTKPVHKFHYLWTTKHTGACVHSVPVCLNRNKGCLDVSSTGWIMEQSFSIWLEK